LRHLLGLAPMGVHAQHGELVASEPGGGVARAQQRREPPRDGAQDLVAGGVAEAVVDGFEVVEVAEQHRQAGAVTAGSPEALFEPVGEQCPVGQPGQRIVQRLMRHPLLQLDPLAGVLHVHDQVRRGAASVAYRRRGDLREQVVPVGVLEPAIDLHPRFGVDVRQRGTRSLCLGQVVRVGEGEQVFADQLGVGAAEHVAQRRVDPQQLAGRGGDRHADRGVAERTPQVATGGLQLPFDPLALEPPLRRLPLHRDPVGVHTGFVLQRTDPELHPER
jgi:hypothetical protein